MTEFDHLGSAGVRVDSGVVDGSVVSIFYDPMLAKVISYAPTRRQAAGDPGRRADPDPPARHVRPTATCWSTCCAIRPSSTAPPTPRSSTPTAWPSWPHRWPTPAAAGCRPSRPPLWPMPPQNRRTATVFRRLPSGWRNLPRATRPSGTSTPAGDDTRGALPVHPRPAGARPARRRDDAVSASARPGGAGRRRRGAPVRRRPLRRSTCSSTRRSARCSSRAAPLPGPRLGGRTGLAAGPDAGLGASGSAPRSATRSRPASR